MYLGIMKIFEIFVYNMNSDAEFSVKFEKKIFFWSDRKKVINPLHASAAQRNEKHICFIFD